MTLSSLTMISRTLSFIITIPCAFLKIIRAGRQDFYDLIQNIHWILSFFFRKQLCAYFSENTHHFHFHNFRISGGPEAKIKHSDWTPLFFENTWKRRIYLLTSLLSLEEVGFNIINLFFVFSLFLSMSFILIYTPFNSAVTQWGDLAQFFISVVAPVILFYSCFVLFCDNLSHRIKNISITHDQAMLYTQEDEIHSLEKLVPRKVSTPSRHRSRF